MSPTLTMSRKKNRPTRRAAPAPQAPVPGTPGPVQKPQSPLGSRDPLVRLLDANIRHLYQRLESEDELDDEELDDIETALDELEPERKAPTEPFFAVTAEGAISERGARYDAGLGLWNDRDAFTLRQKDRLPPNWCMMLFDVTNHDGDTEKMEVAVRRLPGTNRIEILGQAPPPPRPLPGDSRK